MIKFKSATTTIRCITVFVLTAILFTAVTPLYIPVYADEELSYPYEIVSGDPILICPAAEGRQPDMASDTWFLEGLLEGKDSGRQFAFIAVYVANTPVSEYSLDFYSLAFYDLDTGDYGTHTTFVPSAYYLLNAATGYLDLRCPVFEFGGQQAVWTTAIDEGGSLIPFTYNIDFLGLDHQQRNMRLTAEVEALKPPVPVGADTYNGMVEIFKQEDQLSYFQTGLEFDGTLTWGDIAEEVQGQLGHIDRQMFPLSTGTYMGPDGRDISHEWRTYFLDNGFDFSSWRQFDRTNENVNIGFNGATVIDPMNEDSYVDDIVYTTLSYRRVDLTDPVQPLAPPRAPVRYFPDRHRITSKSLKLWLETESIITDTPMLAFPIEYVHGPVLLTGCMNGKHIEGIGSFERTLGLYRDFEIAMVLSDTVSYLPAEAFKDGRIIYRPVVKFFISRVEKAIDDGDTATALSRADGALRTAIEQLMVEPYRSEMLQILDDLINVLINPPPY